MMCEGYFKIFIYIGVLEAKMLNIQIHMLLTLIVISKQLRFHDLKTFKKHSE